MNLYKRVIRALSPASDAAMPFNSYGSTVPHKYVLTISDIKQLGTSSDVVENELLYIIDQMLEDCKAISSEEALQQIRDVVKALFDQYRGGRL